ncbi:MAG: V-type ATP synthase subunit D, partial [Candidatus Aenigmarchaeota archaeon]|nr:V-type ATP synthase subunit D [Candidatus Aenigmarchaeota archaeon]
MGRELKATRSELLKLKKQYLLAKNGHKLLKKKRDGLIMEFFKILKDAKGLKNQISDLYVEAQEKIKTTEMYDGGIAIKTAAAYLKEIPLDIETKNLMGVKVPKITKQGQICKSIYERGYSLIDGSVRLNNTSKQYEMLLEKIIDSAEIETTLRKILIEVEKTKRRVNALEFVLLPRLEQDIHKIKLSLEEQERE